MSQLTEQIIPPMEFVERFNSCPDRRGMPYLTALDPLVMFAWHLINEPPPSRLCLISGV